MGDYDLYINRMASYGNTVRSGRMNAIINRINSAFKDSPSYFEVKINDNNELFGVHIIDDVGSLNEVSQNSKYILMKPSENLNTGDLIEHDNKKWLCTACEMFNTIYYKGKIVKCNNTLSLYKNNTLHQIPIIIESGVRLFQLGSEESRYIETPSSTIVARLPNNSITSQIKRSEKYKLGLQNYEVKDVNDAIEPGLIILKLEYSQESQQEYNFTLNILNGDNLSIQENTTLQINTQVKMNGEIISPTPLLLFESSDENIATVDENGLITALSIIDNCVITVSLASNPEVKQNININIIENIQDNFTVSMSGSNSIIKDFTSTYSAEFKNNGLPIVQESVFYLRADDGVGVTSLAEIVSQDSVGNTCVVKGLGLGYVRLFVKNADETIVSNGLRIQIRNIF